MRYSGYFVVLGEKFIGMIIPLAGLYQFWNGNHNRLLWFVIAVIIYNGIIEVLQGTFQVIPLEMVISGALGVFFVSNFLEVSRATGALIGILTVDLILAVFGVLNFLFIGVVAKRNRGGVCG